MDFIERAQAPTPKFFKILRTIGLALLAVGGAILNAVVALSVLVVTIAGFTVNMKRRRAKFQPQRISSEKTS